jgi:D-inositol-3-phosphate glycosyltransferase
VTYAGRKVDDMVAAYVPRVEPLLDPARNESIDQVVGFIRDNGIRLVNLHSGTTAKRYAAYYVRLFKALREQGVRIVATLHDVLPFSTYAVNMTEVRELDALADAYVVGNETQRAKLLANFDVGDRPIGVAPHGPYTLFDNHRFDRDSARKFLDLPAEARIVLFFGRLRPDKGLDCMLRALPRLRERVPGALLFISTDTSYTPQWDSKFDALIAQGHSDGLYVRREYVPSDMIEPIFKASDVIAMSYENVSQSGVHNLAKAFELPVVVSDVFDDAKEIDRAYGRAVPVNDDRALAGALADLLSCPNGERDAMGAMALKMANETASWEINAGVLRDLFRQIEAKR